MTRCPAVPLLVLASLLCVVLAASGQELGIDVTKAAAPLSSAQLHQLQTFVESLAARLLNGTDLEVAQARQALINPLASNPSDIFVRAYAAGLLPTLDRAVRSDRLLVKINALVIAAALPDPTLAPVVELGLADSAPAVRYQAVRALEQLARRAAADTSADSTALAAKLLQALQPLLTKPQPQQLWRAIIDALCAFSSPQARQQLSDILNQRVLIHARQPDLSLEPERKALAQVFLQVVQQTVKQQKPDPQTLRLVSLIAFRYFSLCSAIAADQGAVDANLAGHREMAQAADRILRWTVQTISPTAKLPPALDDWVRKGRWDQVRQQDDAWRKLLVQPPLQIPAADLAVPAAAASSAAP